MTSQNLNIGLLVTGISLIANSFCPNYYLLALVLAVLLGIVGVVYFLSSMWVTSSGNEWLLIIQNGELKKAGVGLKTIKLQNQQVVKFPSTINGVNFQAAQVTSENFGIEVKGIVYWAVNRVGDGPFKCYKYIQGTNADDNVRQMTESIVRSQISNTTLVQVLKNRKILRESLTKNLRESLNGWGIWAETVEITEVLISSNTIFKDMQTEFRFIHKQKSQKSIQETEQQLEKLRTELKLQKSTIENDLTTKYIEIQNKENLQRQIMSNDFKKKELEFEKQKLEFQQKLEVLENELYFKQEQTVLDLQQKRELLVKESKVKQEQLDRDLENTMNETNRELLQLRTQSQLYNSLYNLEKFSINAFIGPKDVSGLMPALSMFNKNLAQVE